MDRYVQSARFGSIFQCSTPDPPILAVVLLVASDFVKHEIRHFQ